MNWVRSTATQPQMYFGLPHLGPTIFLFSVFNLVLCCMHVEGVTRTPLHLLNATVHSRSQCSCIVRGVIWASVTYPLGPNFLAKHRLYLFLFFY
ncbi:hypothetical protein F4811DRAFT_289907 [Daldinia bambusicola]|nr:hypothetical protein F4811DRAFT_289907 [Daldinia bambusicola]